MLLVNINKLQTTNILILGICIFGNILLLKRLNYTILIMYVGCKFLYKNN